jgi:hypothetical protein
MVMVMVVMVMREMSKSEMRNADEVAKVVMVRPTQFRVHVKLQILWVNVRVKLIVIDVAEVISIINW